MPDQRYHDSFRGGDDNASRPDASAGSRKSSGNDPLAELARLIGQNDPFHEFDRQEPTRAAPLPPAPDWHDDAHDPYAEDAQDDAAAQAPRAPASGYRPATTSGEYLDRAYYSEPVAKRSVPVEPDPAAAPAYHAADTQGPYAGEFDPVAYEADPHGAHGHEAGDYYVDPHGDHADPVPASHNSRRVKVLALALIGFAVVGTSGAYGIRRMLGHGGTSPPPVIVADQSPTKIIPAKQAPDTQSNKSIQDRVGGRGQNEKIVSREEQPIDVRDPAKAYGPSSAPIPQATPGTATGSVSAGVIPSNAPPPPAWVTQNEPKKVRTMPIRPDQQGGSGTPLPSRTASAAPATVPARSVPKPPPAEAAPPASANAPLSLAPSDAPAPAAPSRARTAAVPPPSAPAPSPAQTGSVGGEGRYAVQIASQRSETDAQATFRSMQSKYAGVLGDRSPIIRRADLGEKGVYYRALVGGFATEDEAKQFCSNLKAAGGQCLIQRN